jgi:hypothetical protein
LYKVPFSAFQEDEEMEEMDGPLRSDDEMM